MFNVIAKIAAGAVVVTASNYVGKAVGEKIARDNKSQIDHAKARKAARRLADLLIDIYNEGVKTELHEKTWNLHQEAKASECIGSSTAMVVETREQPHVGFYQTRLFGGQTILIVDGCEVATFNTTDFRGVIKAAIAAHIFVEGYNMEA
jgi:hypothetical protein